MKCIFHPSDGIEEHCLGCEAERQRAQLDEKEKAFDAGYAEGYKQAEEDARARTRRPSLNVLRQP